MTHRHERESLGRNREREKCLKVKQSWNGEQEREKCQEGTKIRKHHKIQMKSREGREMEKQKYGSLLIEWHERREIF